jgi:RNA polymerase sigma-70 factor (ECF subfamily)
VTDAELVARARLGDHAAFGELVNRHRTAVYRAAFAALGSPADADDAAQDAFVSAYRRLDRFRGDASFKTWLLAIAWRQAINRRRSRSRWWRRFSRSTGEESKPEGDNPEWATSDPTPEQAATISELRRDIKAEVLALSATLRDALLLAQAGEYSYQEIAAMLGTPVGTIKWRVSEARRVIRNRLRERGYADVG